MGSRSRLKSRETSPGLCHDRRHVVAVLMRNKSLPFGVYSHPGARPPRFSSTRRGSPPLAVFFRWASAILSPPASFIIFSHCC